MLRNDVIEKETSNKPASWISNAVVTTKTDGSIRVILDKSNFKKLSNLQIFQYQDRKTSKQSYGTVLFFQKWFQKCILVARTTPRRQIYYLLPMAKGNYIDIKDPQWVQRQHKGNWIRLWDHCLFICHKYIWSTMTSKLQTKVITKITQQQARQ